MPERNIANYISMSQSYCHTVVANRVRHLIRLQNQIKQNQNTILLLTVPHKQQGHPKNGCP
jgi:hypothetical protein